MGLTKKTILITGASGFIGSFLVEQAIKKQYCTIAGIRTASSKQFLQDPAIHFLELDFTSDISLDTALQECKLKYGQLDFVIHNAGVTKAAIPIEITTAHLPISTSFLSLAVLLKYFL